MFALNLDTIQAQVTAAEIREHKARMDLDAAVANGEPVGDRKAVWYYADLAVREAREFLRAATVADLRNEIADLNAAEEADGTDCFWCCGGGDDWIAEIRERASAAGIDFESL